MELVTKRLELIRSLDKPHLTQGVTDADCARGVILSSDECIKTVPVLVHWRGKTRADPTSLSVNWESTLAHIHSDGHKCPSVRAHCHSVLDGHRERVQALVREEVPQYVIPPVRDGDSLRGTCLVHIGMTWTLLAADAIWLRTGVDPLLTMDVSSAPQPSSSLSSGHSRPSFSVPPPVTFS